MGLAASRINYAKGIPTKKRQDIPDPFVSVNISVLPPDPIYPNPMPVFPTETGNAIVFKEACSRPIRAKSDPLALGAMVPATKAILPIRHEDTECDINDSSLTDMAKLLHSILVFYKLNRKFTARKGRF